MKKENYSKPSITVIGLTAESHFMNGSGGSTPPDLDINKAEEGTPVYGADSKENNVWDTEW